MSILTVNLKHYYQWRGLWVVYLFLVLFAFACIASPLEDPEAGQGSYIGLAGLAFAVGFLVSTTRIDVLTKPFSYCLVGQRAMVRKVIFSVAVVVNLLGSMLFLIYPGLGLFQQGVVVCSAFFAGLTFYLSGVVLAFGIKNPILAVVLFPWLILGTRFGPHVIIERAIVEYPYAVICVGILSGAAVWLWLGRADLARRHCNVPRISLLDSWNREKLKKYNAAKNAHKLKGHPRPWVWRFFLGRMAQYDYLGDGRYVWGVLCNHFAMMVSLWKSFAVYLALLTIVSGYMIHWMVAALIILPVAILGHQRPPVYSSMLTFGGRRERFVSTAVLCVGGIASACAAVLIMVGLSVPLARFMPEIGVKDSARLVFRIIDARFVFIPLVAASFFLTIRLVFYRKPVFMMLLLMLLFALMVPLGIVGRESIRAIITNRGCVAGIAVVGWAIFFLVLGYICEKRCLVGQGRSHG